MNKTRSGGPGSHEDEIFTFAVAQLPFETPSPGGTTVNTFCTLVPLWHEDWEPAQAQAFPNNGLVWWKVQQNTRSLAQPGRLLSGRVEPAPRFDEHDPAKQLYQVVSSDVTALMPEEGLEVLTADERTVRSARDLLNVAAVLTLDHPPTLEAMVRLGGWVYGPFRTRVKPVREGGYSVALDPPGGQDVVRRVAAGIVDADLLRRAGVPVSLDSRPPTRSGQLVALTYEVLDAGSLAELRRLGEPVTLPRDRDMLEDLARRFLDAGERQQLVELLARLDRSIATQMPERQALFEAITREVAQESSSAIEVARALLATGLLDARVREAVAAAVSEEVARRSSELDTDARQQQRELIEAVQGLEARRETLDDEIRTRVREAEALAQQRIETAWAEHAQQVAEERAQLDAELRRVRGWEAPPFVLAEREPEPVDEAAFLARFLEHVDNSGFVYRDLDLRMFHVALKSTELVLVTGAAGTGKSALGELYAEALAAAELRGAAPGDLARRLRITTRGSWLESQDLLGQLNPVTGSFQPASTRLFTQLIAAAEEYARFRGGSGIWPVLLDDVDNAPMQLWFGDFMQAITGSGRRRALRAFSEHAGTPDSPFRAWHTLELSPAVRWIASFTAGVQDPLLWLRQRVPAVELRPADDLHGSGVSRGAPDGQPVRLSDLERWSRDGPLSPGQLSALDAMAPVLARMNVAVAPSVRRLLRRLVSGAQQILPADLAFDYGLAGSVLRPLPLDPENISRLLDIIEDLRIDLPESARALEERRMLAEQHGI